MPAFTKYPITLATAADIIAALHQSLTGQSFFLLYHDDDQPWPSIRRELRLHTIEVRPAAITNTRCLCLAMTHADGILPDWYIDLEASPPSTMTIGPGQIDITDFYMGHPPYEPEPLACGWTTILWTLPPLKDSSDNRA